MDIAAKKLELVQRLLSIMDEKTLQRVAAFFKKEVPTTVDAEDDITNEEYAEFDEEIAKHERGEVKFHTAEESFGMIREAAKTKK